MFCSLTFAAALLLPMQAPTPAKARGPVVVTPEALQLHQSCIVIDGHNDLPWELRSQKDMSFRTYDLRKEQTALHTDFVRLKKGGIGAQFWAAYVPSETMRTGTAVKATLEQIDLIHRLIKAHPDLLEMAPTVADIRRIRANGKIASMIGVEGGHSIDNSLAVLRLYYTLGVRYMTLTHSESLDWADSATDKPKANGLSKFGEEVIREMNDIGMLVDISHVSPDTMKAAIKISRAPIIFSHSSAFAIADHPRNVPDDVLKLTAANGGVVMVNFYSGFIVPEAVRLRKNMFEIARQIKEKSKDEKEYKLAIKQWQKENPIPRGSIHILIDHIDHIVKVAGIDHVGLGSDFDGIPTLPEGLEDVSTYPAITQELLNRGYKPDHIRKILGENLLRALEKAEKAAKK
jgi:membrane dipeptidase